MKNLMYNLRLLFSARTRHFEITAPLREGGYIVYCGQRPANYYEGD